MTVFAKMFFVMKACGIENIRAKGEFIYAVSSRNGPACRGHQDISRIFVIFESIHICMCVYVCMYAYIRVVGSPADRRKE